MGKAFGAMEPADSKLVNMRYGVRPASLWDKSLRQLPTRYRMFLLSWYVYSVHNKMVPRILPSNYIASEDHS
jgi:hypothetical protein